MSDDLNAAVDERIRRIVLEVLAEPKARPAVVSDPLDEKTRERINQYLIISHKPFLTKQEIAIYLDVSDRSITEWTARPPDQNPFPMSYAGGEPRARREQIDMWAEREAQRKRLRLAG